MGSGLYYDANRPQDYSDHLESNRVDAVVADDLAGAFRWETLDL
jgi:hypothetical protein